MRFYLFDFGYTILYEDSFTVRTGSKGFQKLKSSHTLKSKKNKRITLDTDLRYLMYFFFNILKYKRKASKEF